LTFDLRRALRRIKPHRFTRPLRRRPRVELAFVSPGLILGRGLLLDTCVYIDALQERVPPDVEALLGVRPPNHLAVCVAELVHSFGRLDPRHAGTDAILREVADTIADIPPHRLDTASETVVIEAGILAGLVFRLCGLQLGQEGAALNDATIYLHALAHGYTVLTRNVRNFDAMQQILPDGEVLFYDRID
jgi:predicted nucleic acid-binding protein